jgi:hypothetical protein
MMMQDLTFNKKHPNYNMMINDSDDRDDASLDTQQEIPKQQHD